MKPYLLLPVVGALSAALTWGALSVGRAAGGKPRVRYVRMTKTASPVAGDEEGGRGWWEEQRFAEYAEKQGWGNLRLKVKTTVGDYLQKYVASAVAGESPDTIQLTPEDIAYWYDHGLLEPLDPYIEKWKAYREGHINKEVLDLCRGVNGEVLCLSAVRHGPAMWGVRRDWLERLGLPVPTTWAQAREVWRAFTFRDPDGNGQDDTYGFCIEMKTARGEHTGSIEPFLFAAGVRWIKVLPGGKVAPAFNVPEAAETLDFIKQCYKEGLFGKDVMYRTDEMGAGTRFFAERRGGMTYGIYPNFYKGVALQYGMFDKTTPIPFLWKDDDFRRKGIYGTTTFLSGPRCILKTCKDKDAAWKFLEYWLSPEALTQAFSKRGNGRERYIGRFGLYQTDTPWMTLRSDVVSEAKVDPWIEELARPLDPYVVPPPSVASWSEITRNLAEVFVDYYLDRYPTAQAALDAAESRFVRILDAYETELAASRKRSDS
ncbi:MAG: extracellular solute-binding protein [Planctomycetota bacterium]